MVRCIYFEIRLGHFDPEAFEGFVETLDDQFFQTSDKVFPILWQAAGEKIARRYGGDLSYDFVSWNTVGKDTCAAKVESPFFCFPRRRP